MNSHSTLLRCLRCMAAGLMLALLHAGTAQAAEAMSAGASALQEKYLALQPQLNHNQFQQPVYLNSTETPSTVKGDIYAVVDHPFATVSAALTVPANWCDLLILHLNTKYCRATGGTLVMHVGKKYEQPLADTYRLDFGYHLVSSNTHYFDVTMGADKGPIDTGNYRIRLEAVPLADGRSFIHLMYSYSYGFASRLALRTYLATAGSNKVGFTVVESKPGTAPQYVDGIRGTVERNTMRYYLAIDAYLSAMNAAPATQTEQRLQSWFKATERYPRQLHEVDQSSYLQMKRKEIARQNSVTD